jgi:hypothetical protein
MFEGEFEDRGAKVVETRMVITKRFWFRGDACAFVVKNMCDDDIGEFILLGPCFRMDMIDRVVDDYNRELDKDLNSPLLV